MNRIATALLVTACCAVSAGPLAAQGVPQPVAALQQLVGNWSATGTFSDGETTSDLTATMQCESVSAGAGVLCRTEITGLPGASTVSETDLFGWDPGDGLVHWYAVTSAGDTHDHRGGFAGDTLTVEHTGPMEGQLFAERVSVQFVDANTVRFHGTVALGGASLGELLVTATK